MHKSPQEGRDPALIKAPKELSSKDLAELGRLVHDSFVTILSPEEVFKREVHRVAHLYFRGAVLDTPEKIDEKLATDDTFRNYATALCRAEQQYGEQTIDDVATNIYERFHQDLEPLE